VVKTAKAAIATTISTPKQIRLNILPILSHPFFYSPGIASGLGKDDRSSFPNPKATYDITYRLSLLCSLRLLR
jgi:hypothetical protein